HPFGARGGKTARKVCGGESVEAVRGMGERERCALREFGYDALEFLHNKTFRLAGASMAHNGKLRRPEIRRRFAADISDRNPSGNAPRLTVMPVKVGILKGQKRRTAIRPPHPRTPKTIRASSGKGLGLATLDPGFALRAPRESG